MFPPSKATAENKSHFIGVISAFLIPFPMFV